MASATTDKVYTLTLTEAEASALRGIIYHIAGPEDRLGRRETSAIEDALRAAGAGRLDHCEGEITWYPEE